MPDFGRKLNLDNEPKRMFPPLPKVAKYGERYGKATTIQTVEEANEWVKVLVEWAQWHQPDKTPEELEAQERGNIRYYSGYYDNETCKRVCSLF